MVTDVEGTMTRVGKVNQDLIPNAVYCGGKGDEALWRGVESDCHLGKIADWRSKDLAPHDQANCLNV